MSEAIRHDEKCPTCGKFVSLEDGYGDLPPGGVQNVHTLVRYCNERCSDAKPRRAFYEDEPGYEEAAEHPIGCHGVESCPKCVAIRDNR